MIGISFWRICRAAVQNFFRNFWLSIATTIIMTITLLIVLFLYFANILGIEAINSIEQKIDLSVDFKANIAAEQIEATRKLVEARGDVDSVRIVTSAEAVQIFRERHKDDPLIEASLEELDDNPLPATMYIVASDPKFYQGIADHLQTQRYEDILDKVKYEDSREVIERLIAIIEAVKNAGLFVTIVFALLVVLIMFNTVRLAIYSFREEIDIMHLVGASRWFIRGPFIIDSIIVALTAVALTTLIFYPSLKAVAPGLQQFFFTGHSGGTAFNAYTYAVENWTIVVGLELAVAVGLAVFSSMIAIQRYLKT